MKQYSAGGYTRISKRAAARAYCDGKTVYACPVNLRPDGPWGVVVPLMRGNWGKFNPLCEFGANVSALEAYNCTSAETGRYLAYYRAEAETV